MANIFRSGLSNEPVDLKQLQEATGALSHLATLELEDRTYMALGSVHPFENGAQISVLLVKEKTDEEGEKVYEIVRNYRELQDVVPRIIQAFSPDADVDMSNMPTIMMDEVSDVYEEDSEPFVFDCSGDENLIS